MTKPSATSGSTTPHDALFKAAFSLPDNAAAELRYVLPPELVRRIDFASLTLCPGSFVSEALKPRHTDLLFMARLHGHDIRIYVLCEHQSSPDRWMPLRMLGYMLQIWEAFVAQNPRARTLPAILPVVVAHGETGWQGSMAFVDLFALHEEVVPLLGSFVPGFRFALDDLAGQDAASIARREASPFARLALLALQQARHTRDVRRMLRGWLELLTQLRRDPAGGRANRQLFRYLSEVCGPESFIEGTATESDPETEHEMQTLAQMWEQRGWQKGEQRGLQKGEQTGESRMLLRMLRRRFGELPQAVVSRVESADAAARARWADRLLDAADLDDVFA